jgi:hypothetical protein
VLTLSKKYSLGGIMPPGEHPVLELCKCLDAGHLHNFIREDQRKVDIYEKL